MTGVTGGLFRRPDAVRLAVQRDRRHADRRLPGELRTVGRGDTVSLRASELRA